MPIGAAMLTSQVKPGVTVDSDDCRAAECGWRGLTYDQGVVCSDNGFHSARSCIDPACYPFYSRLPNCGGGAPAAPAPAAPAPQVVQVSAPGVPPEQQAAPPTQQNQTPAAVPVTVQTAAGTTTVVSSDLVPGVGDQALVPVQVRIPNIWDLLDPTKASQFEYRGLSTSLPVWVSLQYRRAQAQAAAAAQMPAAPAAGTVGGIPWWVILAIGGAAYALSDRPAKRRVARGRK